MKKITGTALLAAALCVLLTGCGTQHKNRNAEAQHPQTTAVTDSTRNDSSGNDLYEDDDIHRKTDSEPDLIDRAESVIEDPDGAYSEMMTDMQDAMDKID